jgi:hypothetical protein
MSNTEVDEMGQVLHEARDPFRVVNLVAGSPTDPKIQSGLKDVVRDPRPGVSGPGSKNLASVSSASITRSVSKAWHFQLASLRP